MADDEVQKPAPFRFTTSVRGTTPAPQPSTSSSTTANDAQAPPRMLSTNPNGSLVWRGAGSARRKNRYSSPGFSTSRSAPTLKLSPEKLQPKVEGKRRKIEESSESSTSAAGPSAATRSPGATAQLNGSASAPNVHNDSGPSSPSMLVSNGPRSPSPVSQQSAGVPKLNGAASAPPATPRIRAAGVKPTAPAIPSPLRQAWGQNDPPSPPPQQKPKPTRAANIMSELIKETAPPPKPVFSNPYQEACPVPVRPTKKPPLPRRRPAAAAQAGSSKAASSTTAAKTEPAQERKAEAGLSPQKIIEATLPKVRKFAVSVWVGSANYDHRAPSVLDLLRTWVSSRSSLPLILACVEAQD